MKKLNKLLIILSTFIFVCGFKNSTIINMNEDNNLDIEIELLVSENRLLDENTHTYFSQRAEIYEKNGFKVTTINKDGNSGYKIVKSLGNLDKLSSNKNDNVLISNIVDNDFDLSKLYKKDISFFKTTYTANYKYEYNESKYLGIVTDEDELTTSSQGIPIVNEEEDDTDSSMSDMFSNDDLVELTFTVNLPYKVSNSNASSVSNDGKTLTWTINYLQGANINYSFSILNTKNIIISISAGVILLVLLLVLIIIIKRKKGSKETLIHTEYDPAIAGMITETTTDQIPAPAKPLEYSEVPSNQNVHVSYEQTGFVIENNPQDVGSNNNMNQ